MFLTSTLALNFTGDNKPIGLILDIHNIMRNKRLPNMDTMQDNCRYIKKRILLTSIRALFFLLGSTRLHIDHTHKMMT